MKLPLLTHSHSLFHSTTGSLAPQLHVVTHFTFSLPASVVSLDLSPCQRFLLLGLSGKKVLYHMRLHNVGYIIIRHTHNFTVCDIL